jgi:hypothetical protein
MRRVASFAGFLIPNPNLCQQLARAKGFRDDPVPIRKDASAAFLLSLEGPLKDDGLDQQKRQLHALLDLGVSVLLRFPDYYKRCPVLRLNPFWFR